MCREEISIIAGSGEKQTLKQMSQKNIGVIKTSFSLT